MTLIITELTQLGIAMVADSAVTCEENTPTGNTIQRTLTGIQKLQVIPHLRAGISMWGLGTITTSVGLCSTDVWIADFVRRHTDITCISDFASELTDELQQVVGNIEEPLGFHLASHVEQDGKNLPTFYHVRNVDGPYGRYEFHDFRPGQDFPPQELKPGRYYRTRNGDFGPYALLAQAVEDVLPAIRRSTRLMIPYPSLQGRVAYLVAWVKFVSDLYASSGALRTIGGSIASLGITPEGQFLYYPT